MSERFSMSKLLGSPLTGLFWVKVIMYAFAMAFLAFVVYGVYKAYFKRPVDTQNQVVHIASPQPGSHVYIGQKSEVPDGADPFIEIFVEGLQGFVGSKDFEAKVGIRLGVRI